MDLGDIPSLADRQYAIDKERTRRFPALFRHKLERMSASPLAFLRGSAPLFYEEMLADTKDGPAGEGWIVGDLHLENFGAYRAAGGREDENVVFDLNDFDDTLIGPWWLDVLRFTTSLLVASRELGATGLVALELADHMLDAWMRNAFDGAVLPKKPRPVEALLRQVGSRSRAKLLDARTRAVRGERRFLRGPRYADLPKSVLAELPRAFEIYIESIAPKERPKGSLRILDAALRIAGTGSLGGLRIAVLVEGKGGPTGQWIFDLKEQGTPSAACLAGKPKLPPAERVCTGFRACVAHPPRMMGATRIGKLSMSGRRLAPQEDKLDLRRIQSQDIRPLATYLGALLGAAHARGAKKIPKAWSKSDRAALRAQAITLAGLHEGLYLALCSRIPPA
jgi:uncharacterized protein (DUF2252 family)